MFNKIKNWLSGNLRSVTYPLVNLEDPQVFTYLTNNHLRNGCNTFSALGIPSYWRGLNVISQRIGALPIELWRYKPDGSKRLATEHSSFKFCRTFDDWLATNEAIRTIVANALRFGNGFGLIIRDEYAQPTKLAVIEPQRVAIYLTYLDDGTTLPSYKVNIGGIPKNVPFEDMIHIRGLSGEGIVGYSVIEALNTALSLNLKIYRYSETYFENNASPRIVVSYPLGAVPKEEQLQQKQRDWEQSFQGDRRAHRTLFVNNGASVQTISDSAQEAQLLESKQFSLIDIANILNCPVSKLNGQQITSYSSLESDNKAFLEDCLDVWLTQIENEFSLKLLTESEKARGNLRFVFDRAELDTPDLKTLSECVKLQREAGIISTNEARSILGYGQVKDELNVITVPLNFTTLEKLVEPAAEAEAEAEAENPAIEEAETQPDDPQEEIEEEDEAEAEDAARSIRKAAIERLMTRLTKSAHKPKNEDWFDSHKAVFRSALPTDTEAIEQFFEQLQEELQATSSDHHKQVLEYRIRNNNLRGKL